MTGTSIDAIDAALVEIVGQGRAMQVRFLGGHSGELGALTNPLRELAEQVPMSAGAIASLMREFSLAHARVVLELLERTGHRPAQLALVCVHGQTVFHKPPVSWQCFNPWPMVHALAEVEGARVPIVFDLRGADLAFGGQGAPITPIADWVLFRSSSQARAIINLGGFCNVTLLRAHLDGDSLPETEVDGFDVCVCNLLLDEIARRALGKPFDAGGAAALSGVASDAAVDDLAATLRAQAGSGRSLGTGDEVADWIGRWSSRLAPSDLAMSACEALGKAIARKLADASGIFLAGGGAHNAALVRSIAKNSSAAVKPLDSLGVPGSFREAAEFAVLGALCQDNEPITLPRVTGLSGARPVSGTWAGR